MNDKTLSVLLVDDDMVDRTLVRRLLTASPTAPRAEEEGSIAIAEAEDAASALAAMRERQFDAVILDYSLPGRDGAGVLNEAVQAGIKSPILVLTGHGDERLAVELLRAGAADYVPKSTLKDCDLAQRVRQIVKLRRAEDEAKQAAASLQERVQFEQQLIGVVSHDLRNPLSTIRLSAQVLKARAKDDAQKTVVDRIIRATGQADRMIRDLLDFSQARVGNGITIEPAQTDLHEIVRQVLAELRLANPDRDLRLEQTGSGQGFWDPNRLSQLTSNLVGNAYQHGSPGSPIQVSTVVEGDTAVLRVTNAGPPIPADQMPRLFEPLRRGRSVKSSGGGSIGLGLFISQEIARAHGGRIEVESNERATTFTVKLPLSAQIA
ncbi:MAG TPA: ATP-binding protein [Polyangia bacterium]